jgi:hypothetical protein
VFLCSKCAKNDLNNVSKVGGAKVSNRRGLYWKHCNIQGSTSSLILVSMHACLVCRVPSPFQRGVDGGGHFLLGVGGVEGG